MSASVHVEFWEFSQRSVCVPPLIVSHDISTPPCLSIWISSHFTFEPWGAPGMFVNVADFKRHPASCVLRLVWLV